MASNEGNGFVRLSNFLCLACEQTFVVAPSGSILATFVHYLLDCLCNIPSPGSYPAQLATCIFYHHTCGTGMDCGATLNFALLFYSSVASDAQIFLPRAERSAWAWNFHFVILDASAASSTIMYRNWQRIFSLFY